MSWKPQKHQNFRSLRSLGSLDSLGSLGSFGSLGSLGSLGDVLPVSPGLCAARALIMSACASRQTLLQNSRPGITALTWQARHIGSDMLSDVGDAT